MLRLFSLFGRSPTLTALDDALRGAGVHPLLVPEAVKLTVVRLHRPQGAEPGRFNAAAELLAFCMLGREPFVEANGPGAADRADRRLEDAIEAGDSRDAKLVLLALHAGLLAAEIADRIDTESS